MKKKSFYCLFIVALFAFVLQFVAACSDNRIVATISNKEALTAEWIAEDEDRNLELTFNPSSYNADNIETVVSSSNSNVVLASGTKLSAIGPGTATISVAVAGTITDSVEVSVKTRQSVTPLQSFSIENTSELATVLRGVTYKMQPTFTPAEIFTKDNTTPIVEFGTEGILSYEGGYKLKALKKGSTSVSVTVKDKTVKFNVAVEIGVPTLEFTPVANFNKETCTYNVLLQTGEQTTTLKLPRVAARSAEGNDITDGVNVETTIEITDGTVTLGAGQHTIDYSVTDSRDAEKIARKTLTLNVIGSTFAINPTYSSTGVRAFTESVDANGHVTLTSERYGEVSATFNTPASKQYYAEATFNLVRGADGNYPAFGLAHFKSVNTTVNETGDAYNDAGTRFGRSGWLSVKSGSSATYLVGSATAANDHWYDATEMYKNTKFRDNGTFTTMKIAIARLDGTVYTFVDGKLIHFGDIPWDDVMAGTQTTPGIIVCGGPNEVTASNITVLSGSNAETKINTVLSQTSVLGNNPTYRSNGLKTYYEYLGDDGGVRIQSGRYGEIAATFNTPASTLYYAEATFPWLKQGTDGNYTSFGLAHFKSLNTTVNETGDAFNNAGDRYGRDCVISAKSGTSDKFIIGTLPASKQHWYECTQLHPGLTSGANGTPMKIAIARTATMMYTFVNDVLVYSQAMPAGYTDATTPGIITIGDSYSFVISKISILSGTAAQAKITELTTAPNA